MQDKTIKCAHDGCKTEFIHSVKDQEFYERQKYNDPKYCKFHREMRKHDRAEKEEAERISREDAERINNSPFKPVLDQLNKRRQGTNWQDREVDNNNFNEPDNFSGATPGDR